MTVHRVPGTVYIGEVLERIFDRGIVIDGWAHIKLTETPVANSHLSAEVDSSANQSGRKPDPAWRPGHVA